MVSHKPGQPPCSPECSSPNKKVSKVGLSTDDKCLHLQFVTQAIEDSNLNGPPPSRLRRDTPAEELPGKQKILLH